MNATPLDPRAAAGAVDAAASTSPRPKPRPRVIVVGGGLAGIAAAIKLETAGAFVTLIEARKSLGGRAGSFEDPRTGEILDNCQHVLLGCCTNLIDLYRRLGVAHLIGWEKTIQFVDPAGRWHGLKPIAGLPAPLHLGPSMALFGALTLGEKIAASRAMLAMLRMGVAGRLALADVPFGQWLDEHHQPPSLIEKLYDPILVGGLNENTRAASAAYAIQVFQDALLANRAGCPLGVPACPLAKLYEKLPCKDVRLGTRVADLIFSSRGVAGVRLADGNELPADAIVLATNYHAVQKWVPEDWQAKDSRFAGLAKLESSPILGAHLWFDRPVLEKSHAALIRGPLQWLFRKHAGDARIRGGNDAGVGDDAGVGTVAGGGNDAGFGVDAGIGTGASGGKGVGFGDDAGIGTGASGGKGAVFGDGAGIGTGVGPGLGAAVHGVISAAREWVNRPKEECLAMFEKQIQDTFPAARRAKLTRGVVVVEKRATFSPTPGVDKLRPSQAPPANGIENLYLAGDYTLTGWPATMEGAVRGGYLAADAVIRDTGLATPDQPPPVVPDLEPEWPARIFGLRKTHQVTA